MNQEKENLSSEGQAPANELQPPQLNPPQQNQPLPSVSGQSVAQNENSQQTPVDEEENDQENIEEEEKVDNKEEEDERRDSQKEDNNEEGEEGHDEADHENEEGIKNGRKQSSDSIRESRQNETSQLQTTGGKKCFNKLCTSKKIFKKIRSRVEAAKYRFLCKSCYDNYVNNYFCQFCEQIYSNQEHDQEDMNKWVGCDNCERWNHIQCEKRNRHKGFQMNKDVKYECLACSRKSRNGWNAEEVPPKKKTQRDYDAGSIRNRGLKFQIKKEDRISIFHKKPQNFPNLEPFLQSYNFRLWINEALIRDDIDNLRSLIRRPPMEEQPKKVKKIKQD